MTSPWGRADAIKLQESKLYERPELPYHFCVPNQSKSSAASSAAKTPPFEEALKQLEEIVSSMESDELPLESLLAHYESGTRLVKVCQTKLAEAELKILQLEKTAQGDIQLKPVEATTEP